MATQTIAKKHGHASHERGTPTYYTWQQAKGRCYNPNNISYSYYGGRGITVCDEWREDFRNFLRDMGEKPSGTSIDRINNDGPYAPGNCRWATPAEQNANKRQMLWTVEQRAAQAARMRVVGLANRRVA